MSDHPFEAKAPLAEAIRDLPYRQGVGIMHAASVVARVAQDLGLPHAVNDRTLDEGDVGHLTIDARLAQIERMALSDGASIAIGRPYPATLERLREWVKTEVLPQPWVLVSPARSRT